MNGLSLPIPAYPGPGIDRPLPALHRLITPMRDAPNDTDYG
jgi:hypothetical protein